MGWGQEQHGEHLRLLWKHVPATVTGLRTPSHVAMQEQLQRRDSTAFRTAMSTRGTGHPASVTFQQLTSPWAAWGRRSDSAFSLPLKRNLSVPLMHRRRLASVPLLPVMRVLPATQAHSRPFLPACLACPPACTSPTGHVLVRVPDVRDAVRKVRAARTYDPPRCPCGAHCLLPPVLVRKAIRASKATGCVLLRWHTRVRRAIYRGPVGPAFKPDEHACPRLPPPSRSRPWASCHMVAIAHAVSSQRLRPPLQDVPDQRCPPALR